MEKKTFTSRITLIFRFIRLKFLGTDDAIVVQLSHTFINNLTAQNGISFSVDTVSADEK